MNLIEINCSEDCESPPWYTSIFPIATTILLKMALVRVELSILLCGNAFMQRLNAFYHDEDEPTDVLSFPQYECGYDYRAVETEYNALGDIVIAVPVVRQNATVSMHSELYEVTQLLIHGVLHLLGFDHAHKVDMQNDCMVLTQKYIQRML